ncbi:hypothetical protein GGR56DRAFT_393366 [Xylariaceae sp. FL0804]|nr:hypothetical protein GGR56DRAFT_393366 [Xylariaceae sp. FL0804]
MLIDGEKYACDACVRGHRVSNCQHTDRKLQHINKKGRPVSQCDHCRSMRKARSSHVKCDCGEKTHKCVHLQQTVEGHKNSCCCNHGGRCSCSHKIKKEPSLEPVPESESDAEPTKTKPKVASRRRRAGTAHSDPVLSFDDQGHHKPTHKSAKASQKCGPYTLNRGSSMHSTGSASSLGSRSNDVLAHYGSRGSRSRATTSSSSDDLDARFAESGQASPAVGDQSPFQQLNGQLPPLDLSSIRYPEYSPGFDMFNNALSDHDQPVFSAGLSAASVDWAQYDGLEINGADFASSSFDQAQSYAGFDLAGSVEPTLTSNSGDVSEAEDFVPVFGDSQMDSFPSGTAPSYMPTSNGLLTSGDLSNLEFDQFKGTAASSKFLSNPSSLDDVNSSGLALGDDDTYWGMSNFGDGMTQSPDPVAGLWDVL